MSARKNRLAELRGSMSQKEFAEKLGMSQQNYWNYENGKQELKDSLIERICREYGCNYDWLVGLSEEDSEIISGGLVPPRSMRKSMLHPKGAMPIVSGGHATVPLRTLGSVHAGDLTDEETDDGTVEVPSSVADAHPHAFALTVEGDCMDRVVPAGCHVMVDPDVEPRDGSIAVVETQDYQAVMRRWFRGSTTLLLRADSFEAHDDIVMTGDDPVRVVGTVVWFQSSVQMV